MSEVVFVGTSDAFGAGGRRQSAILVRGANGGVLLDCGGTTVTGLCELGIDRGEIDAILVSHFHGDHFGGIPAFLLAALYEDQRTAPLRIAGPPDTEGHVRALAEAMGYGLSDRELSFPLFFDTVPTDGAIEVGPVRARSFETVHQPQTCPHGLVVDTGDTVVGYSGDTGWFDDLPRHVSGVDLFVCECTYHTDSFEYHLNYEELLQRKPSFDCGRVILTHLGVQMADRRGRCEFETADDGLVVKL